MEMAIEVDVYPIHLHLPIAEWVLFQVGKELWNAANMSGIIDVSIWKVFISIVKSAGVLRFSHN